MHIVQGNERMKTSYEADAKFVEKDGRWFLFYDEHNEEDGEITKCRFEIESDTLRMRRNGPIVIEQSHQRDAKTEGYMKTPFGHMDTKIRTFKYAFTLKTNGDYLLALGYDLYTGGEKTGTYLLNITITEKEEVISC
ncbi:MAG: DUF1934 domain-containing protein [Turicibacter sp.]|nr:DUF1934 domain-containing protein [Turicibacter sp.]